MNIAVVGGGSKCVQLIQLIDQHRFEEIRPKIIAVADVDQEAPGMVLARRKGLFTTRDYHDFFKRGDIDLIIELTGSMERYNAILEHKSPDVRAISAQTAQLFWEIARISAIHKKTSQELFEAKALYKTMINELIQEDVLVIGLDYRIIDVNNTVLNRLGLKKQDVVGKFCYEITHRQNVPCSGEKHPCPLIKTLNRIEPYQTTHIHLDKDNREVYFSITTYPLIENGDIFGVIEISRDITQDIKTQKTLMQHEKLASIGRLSAGVAHEINNPLTTILTTAMLLQEDLEADHPTHAELETIASETLRCRKIVTSLLDFARQTKPNKKYYDINNLIRETILLTQKQAAFKDVAVTSSLKPDLPKVLLDKGQIQQSLINLIINAIEALEAGGEIHVGSDFSQKDQTVLIAVQDNGCGIADKELDRIFDPFYTNKDDGSGLGLAITHGIVEQHNGRIDVQSQPGEGSTFSIVLPLDGEGLQSEDAADTDRR